MHIYCCAEVRMSFGHRLRMAREDVNLSKSQLANMVGISQPYVFRIEEKGSIPKVKIFSTILRVLIKHKLNYKLLTYLIQDYENMINLDRKSEVGKLILKILPVNFRYILQDYKLINEYDAFLEQYFNKSLNIRYYHFFNNFVEQLFDALRIIFLELKVLKADFSISQFLIKIDEIRPFSNYIHFYHLFFDDTIQYDQVTLDHIIKLYREKLPFIYKDGIIKHVTLFKIHGGYSGALFIVCDTNDFDLNNQLDNLGNIYTRIKTVDSLLSSNEMKKLFYDSLKNQITLFEEVAKQNQE